MQRASLDTAVVITWIGHATFLIQAPGITILTDPIFGKPSWLFPRITEPGIRINDLPPIDYVLISHNHWDHLHKESMQALYARNPNMQVLVPAGDGKYLRSWGIAAVHEHQWWQKMSAVPRYNCSLCSQSLGMSTVHPACAPQLEERRRECRAQRLSVEALANSEGVSKSPAFDSAPFDSAQGERSPITLSDYEVIVSKGHSFTFTPACHWSQRTPFDRNKSLWGSWMIELAGTTIYFAGDTAYATHFKAIARRFRTIDVALMPVGPCEPHRWMHRSHISAEDAGQAFLELGARTFVPMHWGTFYFGTDLAVTPIKRLQAWWQMHQSRLRACDMQVLHPGQQCVTVPKRNPAQERAPEQGL